MENLPTAVGLQETRLIIMVGRFGKYGDLKRKSILRKSSLRKIRFQKNNIPNSKRRFPKGGWNPKNEK
jgi:hypothetical protein